MESFNQNQDLIDSQETVSVGLRLEKELNDRIDAFAEKTVRSKSHAIKFLVLRGFDSLEQETRGL